MSTKTEAQIEREIRESRAQAATAPQADWRGGSMFRRAPHRGLGRDTRAGR